VLAWAVMPSLPARPDRRIKEISSSCFDDQPSGFFERNLKFSA